MPSGSDELPWVGDYPYPGAGGNQGIHMLGTLANLPAASLGTQTGSDGAVGSGSTAFTAASGRFASANTGDTIQIVDTGASPPAVYSFTVTYVSATALTLSSAWAGTGTSALSWTLLGPGPSNEGLRYFATDAEVEYQSIGTDWLQVGALGWRFDTDNEGGWGFLRSNAPITGIGGGYDGFGLAFVDGDNDGLLLDSDLSVQINTVQNGSLFFGTNAPIGLIAGVGIGLANSGNEFTVLDHTGTTIFTLTG